MGVIHAGGFYGLQRCPSVRESVAVREGKDPIFLQVDEGRGKECEAKRWKIDRKRRWKKAWENYSAEGRVCIR